MRTKMRARERFLEFLAAQASASDRAAPGNHRNGVRHGEAFHGGGVAEVGAPAGQVGVPGDGLSHVAAADRERPGAGDGFRQGPEVSTTRTMRSIRITTTSSARTAGRSSSLRARRSSSLRTKSAAGWASRPRPTGCRSRRRCEEFRKLGACSKTERLSEQVSFSAWAAGGGVVLGGGGLLISASKVPAAKLLSASGRQM